MDHKQILGVALFCSLCQIEGTGNHDFPMYVLLCAISNVGIDLILLRLNRRYFFPHPVSAEL